MTTVKYELDSHIAKVTLDRPDALNAFNRAMYEDFNQAMERFRDDPEAWVAIVTGAGERAFSAGADVKELDAAIAEGERVSEGAYNEDVYNVAHARRCFTTKPIIAAIDGYCIGEGVAVALYCDLRVCTDRAVFWVPEAKAGFPAVRIPARAAQVMGLGPAMDLILLAERRDADWALRSGLVGKVVAPADLLKEAYEWAESLCSLSQDAVRAMKEVMIQSLDSPYEQAVELGARHRGEIAGRDESAELRRAFLAAQRKH